MTAMRTGENQQREIQIVDLPEQFGKEYKRGMDSLVVEIDIRRDDD